MGKKQKKVKFIVDIFTESAERIGVDSFYFLVLALLSFTSIYFGAPPETVLLLAIFLGLGFIVIAAVRANAKERKRRYKLEKLKIERGLLILNKHKDIHHNLVEPGKD
ncbi:MAG: hypothetical protein DHS20C07_19280 [Methyloligella sp.]|nr:MAG: hypothetical protein DHS20C07_19280 [Methyloligella sp.]